jgi:uncharacterized protein
MSGVDANALRIAVERVGHLLPAQGPISVFIHHNVLHAFERLPFEEAVVEAARIYGAQPFWPADRYRALFDEGRITEDDLREVIGEALGLDEPTFGVGTRRELLFAATRYGVPDIRGPSLDWHLHEDGGLSRFRSDLPPAARAAIAATGARDPDDVARVVRVLWEACVAAIGRAPRPDPRTPERNARRHRDVVLDALGIDTDDDVHPLLVRFVSAYFDQGLALWPMPDRQDGLYASFLHTYRSRWLAPFVGAWGAALVELVDADIEASRDAYASLTASLHALGVTADEHEAFLLETALALKGWAGMVHQIELRPDRVPVWPVPASLVDFLAVRLLAERAVIAHVTRARLDTLRRDLRARSRVEVERTEDRAFRLFHVAQLLGVDAMHVGRLSAEEVAAIEAALSVHRTEQERPWLHAAFELQLRKRFFDAMSGHRPERAPRPRMQAIFCVDERMESIRRHLEEVDERIETLSTAGFFGVAMYFQGARDARPRPLAPVAIRPRHFVPTEMREEGVADHFARELEKLRAQTLHVGSRSLLRGAIVSVAGAASLVPLVLRVLFPHRLGASVVRARPQGRMLIDRVERLAPPVGETIGYSTDEMISIVERVLAEVGLGTGSFGRLVVIVGHAADSLNNPHRSAYDCGACGGGPGGANARAFVTMANRPAVRRALAKRGLEIPERTRFLAAEFNTTDDSITFYDEAELPPSHADDLVHARATFDEARRRNAEERLRRFARSAAAAPSGDDALDAVRARRWDLAEPRPEYNHATNAVCVIGRRERTRGLFLDRRAFLVSYDPSRDDAKSSTLRTILDAVVPVVVGINLEYFFGAIDNDVYGAGSKLPHNVAALIGVMNGAQGDLRTGLWSQTVEIHEPVRLTMVVEASPERLAAVVDESPSLARLVRHRWLYLAALAPDAPQIHDFSPGEPRLHVVQQSLAVVPGPSANWFRGKRGNLGFVQIALDPMR